MAFFEWDVTSLTSARQSAADKTAGFWYGTMYGVLGYWLRLPSSAPAIGDITLIASPVASGGGDGIYLCAGYSTIPVDRIIVAKTITGFEKGGRWIRLGNNGAAAMSVVMSNGVHKKSVRAYYRGVNEYTGPTA